MSHVHGSARRGVRRVLLAIEPTLGGHGMSVRAWRTWEAVLTKRTLRRDGGELTDGGLKLPPPALRVRVIGDTDADVFLSSGRSEAADLVEACSAHEIVLAEAGRLLDFGCGCGRVTRHWSSYPSLEVHGSDHDAESIAWLQAALPFVHAHRNELSPPLPYPDDHFGVVYALSVFTHMTDELARAWMAELHRIIRPGGLLLSSATDDRQADRLRPHERAAFDRGESVVQFKNALGTNMCVAYQPRGYIESITPQFDLLSTRIIGSQMLYVLAPTQGAGHS